METPSKTIHLVTAVSRPQNLDRIYKSIIRSLRKSSLYAEWILVADRWADLSSLVSGPAPWTHPRLSITKTVDTERKHSPYGIRQKNLGMGMIEDGYYHCLDDDNIVHPDFFSGIEKDVLAGWKGICVSQRRWDMLGTLEADPKKMDYGQIDNTMFVVSMDLISFRRYSEEDAGREDWVFFSQLYRDYPKHFTFVKRTLAYYNYLSIYPVEPELEFDGVPR